MASKTDIANEALLRIGEPRIVSIEDTTDLNAVFLSTVWENTVKEIASEIPWKCFTFRAVLTASSTAPAFGWTKTFPLPVDCLRVLYVNGYSAPAPDYYSVEGSNVLTDETTAELVYTAYITDTTKYHPLFIEAIAIYLASKLAIVRRQDTELAAKLTEQYTTLIQTRSSAPEVVETKSLWKELGTTNEIINAALLKIGEPRCVGFSDTTFIPARTVAAIYTQTLKQVSREHEWKCLSTRSELTVNETAPAFGWTYSYPIPEDCMRIIAVNGIRRLSCESFWKQEGLNIYTNADAVELEYVAFDDDATHYDNLFINAITALFASRLVAQRRRDANLSSALLAEYNQVLSRARTVDGTQKHDVKYDGRQKSLMERSRRSFR
jgi:hypothetical protein